MCQPNILLVLVLFFTTLSVMIQFGNARCGCSVYVGFVPSHRPLQEAFSCAMFCVDGAFERTPFCLYEYMRYPSPSRELLGPEQQVSHVPRALGCLL